MRYNVTTINSLLTVTSEFSPSHAPVIHKLVDFLKLHPDMISIEYSFKDQVVEGVTRVIVTKQMI